MRQSIHTLFVRRAAVARLVAHPLQRRGIR